MSPCRRTKDFVAMVRLRCLIFFLLFVRNPCLGMIQPEHSIWERSLGTSFVPSRSSSSSSKQHMQVCITIGCCRHVCRQFMGESSEAPQESSTSGDESTSSVHKVAIVPEVLEWTQQALFSPFIKHLTVFNAANDSLLKVFLPARSNDEQFFSQGSEEEHTVAPGGSVTIPIVYLPQQLGQSRGELLLRTSAGEQSIHVRGQASECQYDLSDDGESEVEAERADETTDNEEKHGRRIINFHNSHEQAIQINEVHVWPGESFRRTSCSTELDRVISCIKQVDLTEGGGSSYTSDSTSSIGSDVTLSRQLGTWEIRPGETAKMVELEFPKNGTWTGTVYIQLSRDGIQEVVVIPLKHQPSVEPSSSSANDDNDNTSFELPEIQLGVRAGTGTDNLIEKEIPFGIKTQTLVDATLRPMIRDLTSILLKQPELKAGSLLSPNSQNQALLISENVIFTVVQVQATEKLMINLVNPSDNPVTVKLEVGPQVKSAGCRYMNSWFWQNHGAIVQQNDGIFDFEEGANIHIFVPALATLSVGPLTFSPRGRCDWFGLLFVKNSLTGLEWIPIQGRGGSASLTFLEGQGASVQKLHLIPELTTSFPTRELCQRRMEATFRIKNIGELGMIIEGLGLGEAEGFSLGSTEGFSLEAGEMRDLMISYEPDYHASTTKAKLELVTSIGVIQVPVVATVPRELLAVCGNITLEEKVLLPISVCALVLVLGIFTQLLVREVLRNAAASRSKAAPTKAKQTWKKVFTVWKCQKSMKPEMKPWVVPEMEARLLKAEEAEKSKVSTTRKKKNKSAKGVASSQPGSPCSSSSGPVSPRSTSDSEKKDKLKEMMMLDTSRFCLSKSPSRKKNSKKTAAPQHVVEPEAQEHIQQAEALETTGPVVDEAAKYKALEQTAPCKTGKDSSVHVAPMQEYNNVEATVSPVVPPSVTPPATPSHRAPGCRASIEQQPPEDTSEALSSIGRLRKKAAELSTGNMDGQYDIWGDHFAKISTENYSSSGYQHSLFSQSFPTRTVQDVNTSSSFYCHSTIPTPVALPPLQPAFPTNEELSRAFMQNNFLLPTSNQYVETTYSGYPDPSFDLCTESIYRSIIS